MPQPIICLDEEVRHFAERFRSLFSKSQYQFDRLRLRGYDYTVTYHYDLVRRGEMQPTEVCPITEPPSDLEACQPENTKADMPLDIILSLLRPDEPEKLERYLVAYAKLMQLTQTEPLAQEG